MDFTKLKIGERYLFYHNNNGIIKYFRANYLGIHIWKQYTTLVVKNFESKDCKINKKAIYYVMYADNIINAKTLVDIFENDSCKLPDDMLREINIFY
jgi:hypothetical protein